jgi:hypothetical protein
VIIVVDVDQVEEDLAAYCRSVTETRRQGRPYTLVLTKTDALFERERQQRKHDTADLAWLSTNYAGEYQ